MTNPSVPEKNASWNYRLLAEEMNQGAAILAGDSTILWANRRLAEILSLPLERIVGILLDQFLAENACPDYREWLAKVATSHQEREFTGVTADGVRVPLYLTSTPLPPETGFAATLIVTDLTESREWAELRRAWAELETANELLRQAGLKSLNLVKDALLARTKAEEANARLQAEIAERQRLDAALRDSEERMLIALNVSHTFAFEWEPTTDSMRRTASCAAILGVFNEEVKFDTGRNYVRRVHPDDRQRLLALWGNVTPSADIYHTEYRLIRGDGEEVVLAESAQGFFDAEGRLLRLVGATTDITEQKRTAQTLREAEIQRAASRYVRNLIETSLDPLVMISPDGRITDVNAAMEAVTGWLRDELIHTEFENYFAEPLSAREGYQQAFLTGSVRDYALEIRHRDGNLTPILYNAAVYRNDNGDVAGVLAAARDITEIKKAEKALKNYQDKIEHIAYHDHLTGLPNRLLFSDRLNQAMAQAERSKQWLAVCYLDLDGFKPINDNYGHAAGDKLLVEIARRLEISVRANDTVGRLGGDEFVLLLTNLENMKAYQAVLQRVIEAINQPVALDATHEARITASIGITLFPHDAAEQDILLRHADQAMYAAKQSGRNRYQFFDIHLEQQIAIRHQRLECIRQGLAADEFCLYFQPKVDFVSKTLIGVEALIRWQHPIEGLLEPDEFLPAVEHDDLALAIGDWVIREALRQMQYWRREGVDLQVSINAFARQLHMPDFVASLRQILSEYPDVPPSQLQFEITETASLPELLKVQQIITDCQQFGIEFSIDHFGTGYSSLAYLRHLSAPEIKIDKSFVHDMLTNGEDRAIIEGIIALGRAFQCCVIAEGVETSGQIDRLLELGCKLMQGFGIAHPMPSGQIVTWVREFQPAYPLCHDAINAISLRS